jgi:uncharacterized protein (TIGR02265 family)
MTLFSSTNPIGTAPAKVRRVVDPPDLSISDLASRLQFATDDDTCKGMFFNGVLSATLTLLGPDAQAQVHASWPEKKYVDFFNYPIKTFLPGAFRAARMLQANYGTFDASIRQLGHQAIADFLSTPVGRTLVTVSAGDGKRLMRAAPTAYKTAVSYGTRETVINPDSSCIFKVRRDFMPHSYHEGVFLAVLSALGCKDVKVRGEKFGLMDADYFISWS